MMSLIGKNSRAVRPECRSSGFTLIEVLITLVILSTGIILVLRAFEISLFALGESRDSLWANMLIREKMTDVQTSALENEGVAPMSSTGGFYGRYRDFRWDLQISRIQVLPDSPGGGEDEPGSLNRVIITVWRKGSGRRYSIATYLRLGKK